MCVTYEKKIVGKYVHNIVGINFFGKRHVWTFIAHKNAPPLWPLAVSICAAIAFVAAIAMENVDLSKTETTVLGGITITFITLFALFLAYGLNRVTQEL